MPGQAPGPTVPDVRGPYVLPLSRDEVASGMGPEAGEYWICSTFAAGIAGRFSPGDCPCPQSCAQKPRLANRPARNKRALRPAGKIGKGRMVPALCYGTARKPEKRLKWDVDGPEWRTAAAQVDLASQFDTSLAVMRLDMHRPIGMRRLVLIVLLLLLFVSAGWHLWPSSEPDDALHPRPSAIERTMADVLPRLNLANDWATRVEERELEWMLSKQLQEIEWSSRGSRGRPTASHYQEKIKAILEKK